MFSSRIESTITQQMVSHEQKRTLLIVVNLSFTLSVLFMFLYENGVEKLSKVAVYTDGLSQVTADLTEQKAILSPDDILVFDRLMASALEIYGIDGELNRLDILHLDSDKLLEMNHVAASLLYSIDVEQSELVATIDQHMLHLSTRAEIAIANMDNGFRNAALSTITNVFLIAYLFLLVIELFQKKPIQSAYYRDL